MSRNHGSIAGEIQHTMNSIQNMEPGEIERIYGIIISEDGSLFDPTYQMNFDDLRGWATFNVEQDHQEQYEHITQVEYE